MTSTRQPRPLVVVGASTGLGRATARLLAADHPVIVAGRDVARTRAAVPAAADAVAVDLRSLADVRRCAGELAARGPLGGLVCNAGVQDAGPPTFTADGFETTFAVNHLAHFALITLLLPALAPGARVIVVGSGTLDPDAALARRTGYRGGRYTTARDLAAGRGDDAVSDTQRARDRYATSKLCNILAMRAFARRFPASRVAFHAIDPGLMAGTGLARQMPWYARLVWQTLMAAVAPLLPGGSTPARSATAIRWLLTDPALAGRTGLYVDARRREHTLTAAAARVDHQDELYATSLELAGLTAPAARAGA
jgi:NAD(P)-dependent dehydrogenase (short-subunit alcohol dehydrogenase family)